MDNAQQLADRYVAAWNETDAERRRQSIADLWTPEGEHYAGTREVRGYAALGERIRGSHEKNVRDGGHRFRAVKGARALHDAVTFNWEMLPADSEEVAASGFIFLLVDSQGRIRVDYQYLPLVVSVMPAQAGIQTWPHVPGHWIPAYAGMTQR